MNSSNTNALRILNHSEENNIHRLTTTTSKVKNKVQQSSIGTSNENKNRKNLLKKRHFHFIVMGMKIISTPTHTHRFGRHKIPKFRNFIKNRILFFH
jgi:hypothetical protein